MGSGRGKKSTLYLKFWYTMV